MGFYAPAQIVRDASEHGVAVRGVDINHSQWDCTLEDSSLQIPLPHGERKGPIAQQWEGEGAPPPMRCMTFNSEPGRATTSPSTIPEGGGDCLMEGEGPEEREGR